MSKKVIKPIVLIVVFIAALITFCITTNKENKDMTTKQADATLPVMSFNLDKIKINTLHGYTTEMDPTKMRDCVIPISDDRKLSLPFQHMAWLLTGYHTRSEAWMARGWWPMTRYLLFLIRIILFRRT